MNWMGLLIFLTLLALAAAGCGNHPLSRTLPPGSATEGASTPSNPPPGSTDPGQQTTPPSDPTGLTGTAALDTEELAFVGLINAYRQSNGLNPLQVSVAMTQSSDWQSNDMATKDYFDHTDSLGRDPFTRMAAFGYSASYMGENIAAGNASAQDTFTQWKNSPAHNANMLGTSYKAIGVGRAYSASSSYGWYWTTDFGSAVTP